MEYLIVVVVVAPTSSCDKRRGIMYSHYSFWRFIDAHLFVKNIRKGALLSCNVRDLLKMEVINVLGGQASWHSDVLCRALFLRRTLPEDVTEIKFPTYLLIFSSRH